MRGALLLVLSLAACGRTTTGELAGQPQQPATNEAPLFVFVGSNCPTQGAERDLKPERFDGLVIVRMSAQIECSGLGGDWLIGRALDEPRDFFVGDHDCSFHPTGLEPRPTEYYAVVRYHQTAGLFRTPEGVCLTDANGRSSVTTDSKNIAWGVYRTEAGARAAHARLKSAP